MLCCVCLLQHSKTLGVFDVTNKVHKIAEIVHQHFWFKVSSLHLNKILCPSQTKYFHYISSKPTPNDDNPTQICILCWDKIKDFHDFYQTVKKSHNLFQNLSADIKEEEEKPSTSAIKQEQDGFEENLMQVEVEIDVNPNGEHEVEVIKENPLEAEQIDDIELESEDDSDDSSFNDCENSEISEGDESSMDEDKIKDVNDKKEIPEKKENKMVKSVKKSTKKKMFNKNELKSKCPTTKKKWTDKFLDRSLWIPS